MKFSLYKINYFSLNSPFLDNLYNFPILSGYSKNKKKLFFQYNLKKKNTIMKIGGFI